MENSNVVKKAKEFVILSESISPSTAAGFMQRVNSLLDAGYDLFSSQSIGIDAGGGVGGSGNIMMVVTLARYDYLKIVDSLPSGNVNP